MYFSYLLPTFYVFARGFNGGNPINRCTAGARCDDAPEALAPALGCRAERPRMEEIMNKQTLRAPFAIAALTLALATAPAFAQKGANDGGPTISPPASAAQSQTTATPIPTTPYYGRNPDDGGTGPQPTAQQIKASQSPSKGGQPAAPAHLGRPVDDGGSIQ